MMEVKYLQSLYARKPIESTTPPTSGTTDTTTNSTTETTSITIEKQAIRNKELPKTGETKENAFLR